MQTITIKTNGRTATIHKQEATVGGLVKDENGIETILFCTYSDDDAINRYFERYAERTGKNFFNNDRKH